LAGVILERLDNQEVLPIFIGMLEAESCFLVFANIARPRPQRSELRNLLERGGGRKLAQWHDDRLPRKIVEQELVGQFQRAEALGHAHERVHEPHAHEAERFPERQAVAPLAKRRLRRG
jgi:hypothetical protein